MTGKDTISVVVVPGAHHVPEHFQPVTDLLQKDGAKVVGVRLPAPGDSLPQGQAGSLKVIREAVEQELRLGRDVLLVVHSASGITGPAAIEGLGKKDGGPGVIRILAIAGILTAPGETAGDVLGSRTAEWLGEKVRSHRIHEVLLTLSGRSSACVRIRPSW